LAGFGLGIIFCQQNRRRLGRNFWQWHQVLNLEKVGWTCHAERTLGLAGQMQLWGELRGADRLQYEETGRRQIGMML
jgi:hypothetical protein